MVTNRDMESIKTLLNALDHENMDTAVDVLLLLLGDPLNGTQQRRVHSLYRVVSKAEELIKLQNVQLIPGLCVDPYQGCLSYSQLQMFTLQTLQPHSTAYNISRAFRISSSLNTLALQAACNAVMTKHDVLRTCFQLDTYGTPIQRVQSLDSFQYAYDGNEVMIASIQLYEGHFEDTTFQEFVVQTTNMPFNLCSEPPIRFYAITNNQSASDWVLVIVMHHIVTDPESSTIFWNDFSMYYHQFQDIDTTSIHLSLQNSKQHSQHCISYRDYASWQHTRLRSGLLLPSLQYWIELLCGELPVLELPLDHPFIQNVDEKKAASVVFQSSSELQQLFSRYCAVHGASMFMGLLTLFYILLSRLGTCEDLVIGTPVNGRNHEALQQIMGYFVNILPFRFQQHEEMSFTQFLHHVRDGVVDGFSHMEIPLQKILEHLQFDRLSAHQSVFQVMFAWEDKHSTEPQEIIRDAKELKGTPSSAKFDLLLSMRYATNDFGELVLEGTMEYPIHKFENSTIVGYTQYFLELMKNVMKTSTQTLSTISMIPPQEQQQLYQWGATMSTETHDTDNELFLDEYVKQQVKATPDNTALHFERLEWTYHHLWQQSHFFMSALRELKVTPGTHVGLFLDRGLEAAAAILGILRLRATFIPLDPEFPPDRIQYMLEDSQTQVVLTQRHLYEKFNAVAISSLTILVIEDMERLDSSIQVNTSSCTPDNTIAYILYTSGSTGHPKGVEVTHGNLLTTLRWTVREYAFTSDDMFLQSTSLTLDGSLTQLLSPLLVGGSAVITKKNGLHDLEYIATVLNSYKITFCVFVPSYFSLLIEFMESFPSWIKHVILAGEIFSTSLAHKFYTKYATSGTQDPSLFPTCLVNEYGPTEASVTSTFYRYSYAMAIQETQQQSVPIGQGIDDHHLLVLDKYKRLVPRNVSGELYIGGRGVTLGYWNREEQTQSSFDHSDLQATGYPSMRWYKTGDRVKWLATGDLQFLGRTDSQVKLRGMRIELQEVRNVLLQAPGVKDAEVVVMNDRLMGYVILSFSSPQFNEIQNYLQTRLPTHMLPHNVDILEQWPRTPNGKLDLRALTQRRAVIDSDHDENQVVDVVEKTPESMTRTITMDILKQAWREVLDIQDDKLLLFASFFELGGTSLSAIRVMSLVKTHGLMLTLDTFFRCKNLYEMAGTCTSALTHAMSHHHIVPLNWIQDEQSPLFLIHCVDGTVWKLFELAGLLPFPMYGIQATEEAFPSIEDMAIRYWQEIRLKQPQGPYRIGGYSFGCRVAHAIAQLALSQGQEVSPLTLLDGPPFELPSHDTKPESKMDLHEHFRRTFGYKNLTPQPQDGEYHVHDGTETERDFYDQIAHRYSTHCALDAVYHPTSSFSIQVHLYKTQWWEIDTRAYKEYGILMDLIDIPGTHLSMLQRPHVEKLALEMTQSQQERC